jgi:hypothetical protein
MTQMTHDQALEQFHADMTHSINHADRAFATYLLAKRIGDAARAPNAWPKRGWFSIIRPCASCAVDQPSRRAYGRATTP